MELKSNVLTHFLNGNDQVAISDLNVALKAILPSNQEKFTCVIIVTIKHQSQQIQYLNIPNYC